MVLIKRQTANTQAQARRGDEQGRTERLNPASPEADGSALSWFLALPCHDDGGDGSDNQDANQNDHQRQIEVPRNDQVRVGLGVRVHVAERTSSRMSAAKQTPDSADSVGRHSLRAASC